MISLNINNLMVAIIHIRNHIDKVEVKGQSNVTHLFHAYEECNALLTQLGEVLEEMQKSQIDAKSNSEEKCLNEANQNT